MDNLDLQIEKMTKVVEERKTRIEEQEKTVGKKWQTGGRLTLVGHSKEYKVSVMSVDEIIHAMAVINTSIASRKQATADLGLHKEDDELYEGYTRKQWLSDFKKRIASLTLNDEKKKLKAVEERLSNIMSEDTKRKLELDKIMKDLD